MSRLEYEKLGIGINVKDKGLKGDGVTNDATALNALIASLVSTPTDLYFPSGTFKLGANVTQTSNIRFIMSNGAVFSVDNTFSLSLNGEIEAGLYQIFSGSGTISGAPKVNEIYPQWFGSKGDGVTDDSVSIQKSFDFSKLTKIKIYFVAGTYIASNLIADSIVITGEGQTRSTIKNNSISTACLKIVNNGTKVRDMSIIGNGTSSLGADATTAEGIILDGAGGTEAGVANVDIINCNVTNHGKEGIKFSQGCWIINIEKTIVSKNKLDGIHIDGSDGGQKNIINMSESTMAYNGGSGVFLWATSIVNIEKCTMEGNYKAGILVDCELGSYVSKSIVSLNINNNYFEENGYGHIFIRAGKYTNPSTIYRNAYSISIKNNYGYQTVSKFNDGIINSVTCISIGTGVDTQAIRDFHYSQNNFRMTSYSGYYVADFGDALYYGSEVDYGHSDSVLPWSSIKNLGQATCNYAKEFTVSGFALANGITYNNLLKSEDVVSGTVVYYPVQIPTYSSIMSVGVYVDTDSTNYSIKFNLLTRDGKTINSYTARIIYNDTITRTSAGYVESHSPAYFSQLGRILPDNSDCRLSIEVTRTVPGSYFYLGNPCIKYI